MKSLTKHAIIIGAQRAGSTSLYKMLKIHPGVYVAEPDRPEPKYFLRKNITRQEYLNSFFSDSTKHDQLLLEKSTSYYENSEVPQKIDQVLINVKCLMIIRNPIDRAISNYKFSRDNGLEKRTLREVFLDKKPAFENAFKTSVNPFDYLGRSNYVMHIQPFIKTFGNRFRVLVLEELNHIEKRKEVFAKAQKLAEEKVLDALVGKKASLATRESFRKRLRDGDLDDNEIEIAVSDAGGNNTSFEIPGMPGANVGMINIGEMLGKSMGAKEKKKKMSVKESHEILINDESDKLIEQDKIIKAAKISTENNGIVFLDEIDKISGRTDRVGGDVSREGVQRDLLPLIEGTTVNTKYGPIKTDHILFIASGAFQLAKPSDLLPELQGRLPIRVELEALTSEDFKRILKEPDYSLIKQYVALLKTENVELEFSDDGIDTIAKIASEVNATVENIGARRLHTIIEKILDDISFTATDRSGEKIIINKEYINKNLDNLIKDTDLSKFIL